jgi:superfamily II DNA or RNA helicase
MNSIFKEKYTSWPDLEKGIESLETPNERGEVFEEFALAYFKIRSTYHQVAEVWRVRDIPSRILSRLQIERSDAGIDGLIRHFDGTFTGYQVKFRSNRQKPSYSELTKFWQEARHCDYHLTFASCTELTDLAGKNPKHLQILGLELDELDQLFFDELYRVATETKVKTARFVPASYQFQMIQDVTKGFESADRGKLIAACGTGKTLTALWIAEELKAKRVLFIAPSIALIKQTLKAWSEQSEEPFQYVAICSDSSVADGIDDNDDLGDLETSDLGIPVTTDASVISHKLAEFSTGTSVVFSTYQSLGALRQAVDTANYNFDLAFFDEAHRTAGTNDSDNFSLALFDENIPISKRLFMTATERLIKPAVLRKAAQMNRVLFSMDDRSIYGDVFHRFTFGEAIAQNVISDYRIIVAGASSSEVYSWIKENKFLVDLDANSEEMHASADNLFKQLLLLKVMEQYPVKKTITFHNSIKLAKDFISGQNDNGDSLDKTLKIMKPEIDSSEYFLGHVNGSVNASRRHEILMEFKDSKYGIVSNSRCLTEGVDVPIIDSIYFVDPRSSLIDIVQACGRALRKPRNGEPKLAYFIIPILIPDGDPGEALNKIDYDMIHMLIQSLRDQDNRLEQWIDKLNLSLVTNKGGKGSTKPGGGSTIQCILPTAFDVNEFEQNLYVRIADVNRDPDRSPMDEIKKLRSRKSGSERVFRTIGDYKWESYYSSLIKPSLEAFESVTSIVEMKLISKINNNAASHAMKLGALELVDSNMFKLTEIGKLIKKSPTDFEGIFKEQILKYHERNTESILFPYREILKLLCNFQSISFFEFCFSLAGVSELKPDFHSVINKRFEYVRDSYANIDMASEKNKLAILEKLNGDLDTKFTPKDVWTTSTTVANQWIYWRNHLLLFSPAVEIGNNGKQLRLTPAKIDEVREMLAKTHSIEAENDSAALEAMFTSKQFASEVLDLR